MIDKFKGGPVGLSTIATAVSEEANTIEELYEPFLIRMTSLHRDILTSIDNPNFYYFTPSSREVSSITIGLILSSLLFFLTRKKPINKVQSVLDN